MQRIAFVVLASLGAATVCLAQDTARMEHVVQSYVSSGTFAGSVLVAHGSDVIVSKICRAMRLSACHAFAPPTS
jgi:hypothetical protein